MKRGSWLAAATGAVAANLKINPVIVGVSMGMKF